MKKIIVSNASKKINVIFADDFTKFLNPTPKTINTEGLRELVAKQVFREYESLGYSNYRVKGVYFNNMNSETGALEVGVMLYSTKSKTIVTMNLGSSNIKNTDADEYQIETQDITDTAEADKYFTDAEAGAVQLCKEAELIVNLQAARRELNLVLDAINFRKYISDVFNQEVRKKIAPTNDEITRLIEQSTEGTYAEHAYKALLARIVDFQPSVSDKIIEKLATDFEAKQNEFRENASPYKALEDFKAFQDSSRKQIENAVDEFAKKVQAKLLLVNTNCESLAETENTKEAVTAELNRIKQELSPERINDIIRNLETIGQGIHVPNGLRELIPGNVYQTLLYIPGEDTEKFAEEAKQIPVKLAGIEQGINSAKPEPLKTLNDTNILISPEQSRKALQPYEDAIASEEKNLNQIKVAIKYTSDFIEGELLAIQQKQRVVDIVNGTAKLADYLSNLPIDNSAIFNDSNNLVEISTAVKANYDEASELVTSLPNAGELQNQIVELKGLVPEEIQSYLDTESKKINDANNILQQRMQNHRNDTNAILLSHVIANSILNIDYWSHEERCQKRDKPSLVIWDGQDYFVPREIFDLINILKQEEFTDWEKDPNKANALLQALQQRAEVKANKVGNFEVDSLYTFVGSVTSSMNDNPGSQVVDCTHENGPIQFTKRLYPGLLPEQVRKITPEKLNAAQPTERNFFQRNPVLTKALVGIGIGIIVAGIAVGFTIGLGGFGALALAVGTGAAIGVMGGASALFAAIGGFIGGIVGKLQNRKPARRQDGFEPLGNQNDVVIHMDDDHDFEDPGQQPLLRDEHSNNPFVDDTTRQRIVPKGKEESEEQRQDGRSMISEEESDRLDREHYETIRDIEKTIKMIPDVEAPRAREQRISYNQSASQALHRSRSAVHKIDTGPSAQAFKEAVVLVHAAIKYGIQPSQVKNNEAANLYFDLHKDPINFEVAFCKPDIPETVAPSDDLLFFEPQLDDITIMNKAVARVLASPKFSNFDIAKLADSNLNEHVNLESVKAEADENRKRAEEQQATANAKSWFSWK